MFRDLVTLFKLLNKIERQLLIGATVLFGVSFIFFSIRYFYYKTEVQPAVGGEYTEGIVGQPVKINPILGGASDADRDLIELLFADLMTITDSYTTSTDGKIWTLTLKPEMTWSDDKPLTADDVVFTVETIQNPDALSPLYSTWQGVLVERLSEREVRFTLRTPYVYFLDNLKGLHIAPYHVFESVPPANIYLSNYNLEPVASGPYKFVSYEKEKSGFISTYHLALNRSYPGERALIPTFTVRFFRSYGEAITAFNQRAIDGLGGFEASLLPEFKVGNTLHSLAIPRSYAVFLNQNVNALLKNANLRTALDLAIDRDALIKNVFNNYAVVASGPILPFIDGYAPEVYKDKNPSSSQAIALLEKDGWRLSEDGVRVKTTGKTVQKLELELTVPEITFMTATANILVENWKAIGVKVNINALPATEITGETIKSRNYQMLLFGNVVRGNPDIFSFWHSSQRFQPGLNLSMYENKTMDILLESVRKNGNGEKRLADLAKIQKLIADDVPAIFLYAPNYLYASVKDLGGLEAVYTDTPAGRFEDVNKWFLETNRVFK